jgi:hypothetical protein
MDLVGTEALHPPNDGWSNAVNRGETTRAEQSGPYHSDLETINCFNKDASPSKASPLHRRELPSASEL